MGNNDTQVLWGNSKIIVIDHTSQYKIYKALCLVYEALRGNFPFAYALTKAADKSRYGGFSLDLTAYKQHRSNYNKLHKALVLLSREGYITRFVIRIVGKLTVNWWTADMKLTKANVAQRLGDTYNLSVFESPCPRSMKEVALQDRSDRTAVKQPWCDGQPLHSKHEHGISGEDYVYARKHNLKISRLPKNYVEKRKL